MSGLRGVKPDLTGIKRLKFLMSGEAKTGKTTCAITFPRNYIIDDEAGTTHSQYTKKINENNSAVFVPKDFKDLLLEIKSLASVKHDFTTLTIDPITTLYEKLLIECEEKVGSQFGKHFAEANKQFKKLYNLLTKIDMNVIIIAHSKKMYNEKMEVIGETFDGFKKMDYMFDLWLNISRGKDDTKRYAHVKGTRFEQFKDNEIFQWSYGEFEKRIGKNIISGKSNPIKLATEKSIQIFTKSMSFFSENDLKKNKITQTINDAGGIEFMTEERIAKGIQLLNNMRGKSHSPGLENLIAPQVNDKKLVEESEKSVEEKQIKKQVLLDSLGEWQRIFIESNRTEQFRSIVSEHINLKDISSATVDGMNAAIKVLKELSE